MGVGKSTIGPLLAKRLGRVFFDADLQIADRAGMDIRSIFAAEGEAGFRARERVAVTALLDQPPAVIALGGGAVLDSELRRLIRSRGMVITLTARLDTLSERIDSSSRPLWNDKVEALLRSRAPAYADADLMVSTDDLTPAAVVQTIAARLAL